MELSEALAWLSDGHSVLGVEGAIALCEAVGVPFSGELVFAWESTEQAWGDFGFMAAASGPGTGVNCLALSYHVAKALGLGAPGRGYSGRGFQAQANGRAIARLLVSRS